MVVVVCAGAHEGKVEADDDDNDDARIRQLYTLPYSSRVSRQACAGSEAADLSLQVASLSLRGKRFLKKWRKKKKKEKEKEKK